MDSIPEVFNVFSKGSDKIEASQIGTIVRAAGRCPTEKDVEGWIKEIGGPTTKIDAKTCQKYYAKVSSTPKDLERDMRNAFTVLDTNGKGFINEAELRQILCSLGEEMTNGEFNLMLSSIPMDNHGTIDYHAFVDMLLN